MLYFTAFFSFGFFSWAKSEEPVIADAVTAAVVRKKSRRPSGRVMAVSSDERGPRRHPFRRVTPSNASKRGGQRSAPTCGGL
jgi:hypothetical protein